MREGLGMEYPGISGPPSDENRQGHGMFGFGRIWAGKSPNLSDSVLGLGI
jgi:hypothetical protein